MTPVRRVGGMNMSGGRDLFSEVVVPLGPATLAGARYAESKATMTALYEAASVPLQPRLHRVFRCFYHLSAVETHGASNKHDITIKKGL